MKLFRIALPLLLCLLSLNCHAADDSAPRFDYWTTSNTLAQKSRNLDASNAILDKLAALPELSPYEQLTLEILRNRISGAFAGWGPNPLKTEQDAAWNIARIAREQAESIPEISAAANEALFSMGYSETGPSSDIKTGFRLASSALDYWAGCTDIDKARIRYISLAQDLFDWHKHSYSPDKEAYTQAVRTVIEQALRIATDDLTRIRLHMDLASSYFRPYETSKDSPIADILRAQHLHQPRGAGGSPHKE
ncbi:MAG: hypothetical protein JW942_10475 [Opitutales bacterium]|nr:hypothetical protein [Opitutales bacterium]